MLVEVSELNRLRVERDLPYARLAGEIGITTQALYRILTVPNPRVHDRTLFKIQQFLKRVRAKGARA